MIISLLKQTPGLEKEKVWPASVIQVVIRRPGSFHVQAVRSAGTVGEAVWLRSGMERARRQEWRRTRSQPAKAGAPYAQPPDWSIRINQVLPKRTGSLIASGLSAGVLTKKNLNFEDHHTFSAHDTAPLLSWPLQMSSHAHYSAFSVCFEYVRGAP